jgi:hypothetical protein
MAVLQNENLRLSELVQSMQQTIDSSTSRLPSRSGRPSTGPQPQVGTGTGRQPSHRQLRFDDGAHK